MKQELRSVLKDTFVDTYKLVRESEIPVAASSLAYTTILSVIPLIAVSFSIFKAFGGLDNLYATIEPFIFENLAEGSDEKTLNTIKSFIGNIHARSLGVGGLVGLLATSMSMLSSVEKSINKIWKTPMNRGIFQRVTIYWFFITLGPLALAVAIGAATSLDLPLSKILPSGTPFFFILVALFYGMYRYIPHRRVYWRAALISAFGTSLIWLLAKVAYGIYVRKIVTYDRIYGSLGAIPIFLVWVYLAWLVVLTGAAFSATLQSRYPEKEGSSHDLSIRKKSKTASN
jgi:membrane protein